MYGSQWNACVGTVRHFEQSLAIDEHLETDDILESQNIMLGESKGH
jgi:hypothetical protein